MIRSRWYKLCGFRLPIVLLFVILSSELLYSQDSINRYLDNNELHLLERSDKRSILPYKLSPAFINEEVKTAEDSLMRTKNSISKAITELHTGNLAMALFSIHDALTFCPKNEIRTYAIANSYYGLIQIKAGNYSKAVKALNNVDTLFRKLDDLYADSSIIKHSGTEYSVPECR